MRAREAREAAVTEALRRCEALSTPGGQIPRVADEVEVCAAEVASRIDDCPELVTALNTLAEARDQLVVAYYAEPSDSEGHASCLLDVVADFDRECLEVGGTDSARAWELIGALADALADAAGIPRRAWASDTGETS